VEEGSDSASIGIVGFVEAARLVGGLLFCVQFKLSQFIKDREWVSVVKFKGSGDYSLQGLNPTG
jgi:hypothetical protein